MIDLDRIEFHLQNAAPLPLYARVRDALTEQITDGTLKASEMLPSERILQEKLNVSRATIRQALRGLVEAGLIQAVPGSGNYVLEREKSAHSARPLLDSNVAGLIVSYPSFHIYYGQLAAVFNQHLRQSGWHTDLALHNDRAESLQEMLSGMLEHGVRVFSINPPPYSDVSAVLDDLLARGALVQLLGRWVNYPRCDFVGANNELIGYQAAQHLIHLGHTQIIYLGGTAHPTGRDRASGYLRALQEAGLRGHIFSANNPQDRRHSAAFEAYLDEQNSPEELFSQIVARKITAAFCFNDEGAAWMYNEIRKYNLVVPRDLSLVSVDNMPFYGYLDAPLTTFALPGEEVGRQAAELLLRRIAGESFAPQHIYIPARFVQRLSTAAPRA